MPTTVGGLFIFAALLLPGFISYIGGFLDWYSTEVVENGDRDFVLAEPITMRPPGARATAALDAPRLILSAREVRRLYVSYIAPEGEPATAE